MALEPGRRLGPYEIVSALGAGGMGEVYKATDTRLDRTVAIKVLPAQVAADPDLRQRFEREARTISSLNHQHICTLYDVGREGQAEFLVMEFVDGRTLAELIRPGGLPLGQFVSLALPLVDAVSAAHKHGVVHRDLKPANIMVRRDGNVKVLDFGLAKVRAGQDFGTTHASTQMALTRPNSLVGTASYMSPEQAEGQPVDARSDVFSLGIVLFELVTGTRPFGGASAAAVISSILRDEPPSLSGLRPDLPASLARAIDRCLAKDPRRRYSSATELYDDLAALEEEATVPRPAVLGGALPRPWRLTGLAAGGILVAGVVVWFGAHGAAEPPSVVAARFAQLTADPGIEWFPSLSPDGQWVLYASDRAGNRDIYLQSTTGETAINLTESSLDDEDQPAWSPDGEQIAFRSSGNGGGLFVMGRTGEASRRVTDEGFSPAWSPDGTSIVYATGNMDVRPANTDTRSELWIVSASGGDARRVYEGDATLPAWSPNGHRIAFGQRLGAVSQSNVLTIPAEGGEATPVTTDLAVSWNPAWAPDGRHLYFVSNRGGSTNIWRVAIDEESGAVLGDPEAVTTPAPFAAHVTISGDGQRLAYSSVLETQNIYRLELDPASGEPLGDPEAVTRGTRFWSSPDPSPAGDAVVFYSQVQPEGNLYIIDANGSGLRQLTGDAATDRVPRWSPDGAQVAFFSDRSGQLQVWTVGPDGGGLRQLTSTGGSVSAWSPDSFRLAFAGIEPSAPSEPTSAGIIDVSDASVPTLPLVPAPPPNVRFVPNSWSPNGRWLVGQHWYDQPGVSIYDLETQTYEALTEFGQWPVWLPDSRLVLFVADGREFHVVDRVTRSTRLVFETLRDTLGPPRLTSDGRYAFFSRRVTESDIWVASLSR